MDYRSAEELFPGALYWGWLGNLARRTERGELPCLTDGEVVLNGALLEDEARDALLETPAPSDRPDVPASRARALLEDAARGDQAPGRGWVMLGRETARNPGPYFAVPRFEGTVMFDAWKIAAAKRLFPDAVSYLSPAQPLPRLMFEQEGARVALVASTTIEPPRRWPEEPFAVCRACRGLGESPCPHCGADQACNACRGGLIPVPTWEAAVAVMCLGSDSP